MNTLNVEEEFSDLNPISTDFRSMNEVFRVEIIHLRNTNIDYKSPKPEPV